MLQVTVELQLQLSAVVSGKEYPLTDYRGGQYTLACEVTFDVDYDCAQEDDAESSMVSVNSALPVCVILRTGEKRIRVEPGNEWWFILERAIKADQNDNFDKIRGELYESVAF